MNKKKIVRGYNEQFYAQTFENLDEINKFLGKKAIPKWTPQNWNNPISIKKLNL